MGGGDHDEAADGDRLLPPAHGADADEGVDADVGQPQRP